MDFIAGGLVELIGGVASAVVLAFYAWWKQPIVLGGAWVATHWLLRESRHLAGPQHRPGSPKRLAATPITRIAWPSIHAGMSKELRMFGLVDWTIDRFVNRRTLLSTASCNTKRLGYASGP